MLLVLCLSTPGFGFDYVAVALSFTRFCQSHFQAVRGLRSSHVLDLVRSDHSSGVRLLCLNFNSWVMLDSGLWPEGCIIKCLRTLKSESKDSNNNNNKDAGSLAHWYNISFILCTVRLRPSVVIIMYAEMKNMQILLGR